MPQQIICKTFVLMYPKALVNADFREPVFKAVIISAFISCIFGLIIVLRTGIYWFILLGIACFAAAWFYAGGKHPYGYKGWGEVRRLYFSALFLLLVRYGNYIWNWYSRN